ncbi:hypothetical protein IAR55_005874 [Kwoniella newhampshirensis]|uniref:CNNM transmembrane domain-containing protein n=1 Tax=Kwoniella newhampshirensis TaxID=1651941 RepID=A0AAW0YYL6_9TREE
MDIHPFPHPAILLALYTFASPPCIVLSRPAETTKHVHVPIDSPLFGWYILAILGLVLLGGVFSGLTLGLMGLDTVNLQVLSIAGTDDERIQAPRVLRLLSKGRHTMLVVLLLGNTLINTSLPIFLDSIVGGGWIAVLGSTFLILIFGESYRNVRFTATPVHQSALTSVERTLIAICNRYGLAIGATLAPLVRLLIVLMYPIAKPISIILDCVLGAHDDPVTYRKAELKTFVSLGVEDKLGEEELGLLGGVLEFSGKTVEDVMTAKEDMYALSAERILDDCLVREILRKGYSRIPIYEPSSPGAYILRGLVGYDPTDLAPTSKLVMQALPQCPPDLTLLEVSLEAREFRLRHTVSFQTGRSHMLLVTDSPGSEQGALGLVTLEDVVEELIGKEIIDETDVYVDIHSRVPVVRPKYRAERSIPGLKRIFEGQLARRRVMDGDHGTISGCV